MFKIDLLKGQAIPLKSKPGSLVIIVLSAAIPVIVAVGMLSFYHRTSIAASAREKEIVKYQAEIDKLSGAVKLQRALEDRKILYRNSLSEVNTSLKRHTQWSPILTTIMENIPDSVVLHSLSVEYKTVKRKAPKKDSPDKMVEVDALVRTLRLGVIGSTETNNDEAVRDFRDRLLSSKLLGQNIGVSQKSEMRNGREVVSYEICCVLK